MPVTVNEDKVWFDETRKLDQICNQASAIGENGQSLLLLSHFDATLAGLDSLLGSRGIRHERFSSLNPGELCSGSPAKIWLASTRAFHVTTETPSTQDGAFEIIVAEHHPMQSRDQQLVDAAAKLSCQVQLTFYFSLDDPVMKHFGSDHIKALFERLGIDKDECISHHLINTAMRTAQQKIEKEVGKDVATHSATDWFKYNLPDQKQY